MSVGKFFNKRLLIAHSKHTPDWGLVPIGSYLWGLPGAFVFQGKTQRPQPSTFPAGFRCSFHVMMSQAWFGCVVTSVPAAGPGAGGTGEADEAGAVGALPEAGAGTGGAVEKLAEACGAGGGNGGRKADGWSGWREALRGSLTESGLTRR